MLKIEMALIRRELLEHKALYVGPAVLGLVLVLLEITGHAAVEAFGNKVDIALLGATNIGVNQRAALLSVLMTVLSSLFVLEMGLLAAFYTLDSLYAERKDKSILFWRSLPVTDAETVLSKLITALVVIPLITMAFIIATHILVLLVTSFWVGIRGANAWHLIWQAVPLLDNWGATIIVVIAMTLWMSPFIGWFLLVSAYTKRSPMLMAVLPIIILPMLERTIMGSRLLFDALFVRTAKLPIYKDVDLESVFSSEKLHISSDNGLSMMSMLDVGRFLTSPGLWAGLIVCALLTAAAIYVRRYRDES